MNTTNVTFEGIKQNIVEVLAAKNEFKDINFTAPAIVTLIDALAYTSHYLLRYANFSINECFLDSAQQRANIVSRAKSLGYMPYQYCAARNKIRLKVKNPEVNVTTSDFVPANTVFTATDGASSYRFSSLDNAYFYLGTDGFWYADVSVVEGTFVEEFYTQDLNYTTKYLLSNAQVDTKYIRVTVKDTSSAITSSAFSFADDIVGIGPDSLVYFMQESYDGNIEIQFGDGVLGKKLEPNNYVSIKYLVTSGAEANNIIKYGLSYNIGAISYSDISITQVERELIGSNKEPDESVKFLAPKMYQRQNRNVTAQDYAVAIKSLYGDWIQSITVWGGEENIPPQYGRVFISIKPKDIDVLTDFQKEDILASIAKKNIPCIGLEIVDPSIIHIDTIVDINWYPYKTNLLRSELSNKISDAVIRYFNNEVENFGTGYKNSQMLSIITNVDPSIASVATEMTIKQFVTPLFDTTTSHIFFFNNKLKPGSIVIGTWVALGSSTPHYIYDLNGKLMYNNGLTTSEVGTVDYTTGRISLESFNFNAPANTKIKVSAIPDSLDINSSKNIILGLDSHSVFLTDIK